MHDKKDLEKRMDKYIAKRLIDFCNTAPLEEFSSEKREELKAIKRGDKPLTPELRAEFHRTAFPTRTIKLQVLYDPEQE